jgi:hypothetical protein
LLLQSEIASFRTGDDARQRKRGFMSNRLEYHLHRNQTVPYEKTVTINEHCAPTADSARLLSELEKEAWAKIINVVSLRAENFFELIEFEIDKILIDDAHQVRVVFCLSKEPIEIVFKTGGGPTCLSFWAEVSQEITKKISFTLYQALLEKWI